MKASLTLALALVASFLLGFAAHTLTSPTLVLAAQIATPSPSPIQPMPMGNNMSMGTMDCARMHSMMQSQMRSDADKAMMGMHRSMTSMKMTGSPDQDFMLMMIPHHQSAINMAQVELRYGKDGRARGLATNIISTQQREIYEMRSWLNLHTH